MEFKDYYKILAVPEDADTKAIKTAYRKLARQYHPDVSDEEGAEEKFKEVTEAYEVLGDTKKRAEYDELKQYGGQHGQSFRPPPNWQGQSNTGGFSHADAGDFSDFFESIFGAQRGGGGRAGGFSQSAGSGFSGRGQDVEVELPIFLEDTIAEESKQIAYHLPNYDSGGRRLDDIKKTLKVKIPKGVSDGERIRLKGQGSPGIGSATPGDLYLRIRLIPHPLFDIEGHSLLITVPLMPWEAAMGTKITVPTLQGKISLTIPANSQSGQRLRIKGRGLATKTGQGDLYAVLNVVMPKEVNESSKSLWESLAKSNQTDPRAEWSNYQ